MVKVARGKPWQESRAILEDLVAVKSFKELGTALSKE